MKTDREKLIDILIDGNNTMWWVFLDNYQISAFADYLISKGVTIPVRCKDCKKCIVRRLPDLGTIISTHCNLYRRDVNENEFCSYGERKEE